jgi:hypothetical protein
MNEEDFYFIKRTKTKLKHMLIETFSKVFVKINIINNFLILKDLTSLTKLLL